MPAPAAPVGAAQVRQADLAEFHHPAERVTDQVHPSGVLVVPRDRHFADLVAQPLGDKQELDIESSRDLGAHGFMGFGVLVEMQVIEDGPDRAARQMP